LLTKWLIGNYVEILGVINSLVYLYCSVKQIIWLWPFGMLSSALFIFIFFSSKFYADMGLQVYYLGVSVYGWYFWSRSSDREQKGGRPVSRLKGTMGIVLSAITLALLLLIVFILKNYTDSDVPWGDGFTTAASVVATWMLARKILEHWLVWIVVDGVAAGLYIYKGLYPTALLYLVYSIIAVTGYIQWKKSMEEEHG
jgi:nicotinamide mononucleotide transporter